MKQPRYMPIIGAKALEDEMLAFVRKYRTLAVDTTGEVVFPGCPVTGEPTDRTFPVRSQKRRFDHPVSAQGAKRLQFEHLQWIFFNAIIGLVPVFYFSVLLLLYVDYQTVFYALWIHVVCGFAAMFAVRWALGKLFAKTVELMNSRLPKSFVVLRYKDVDYAVTLYEQNKTPPAQGQEPAERSA